MRQEVICNRNFFNIPEISRDLDQFEIERHNLLKKHVQIVLTIALFNRDNNQRA